MSCVNLTALFTSASGPLLCLWRGRATWQMKRAEASTAGRAQPGGSIIATAPEWTASQPRQLLVITQRYRTGDGLMSTDIALYCP
jgi:hypothetical protein